MNSQERMIDLSPDAKDPTWQRLEDQLNWYDTKSTRAQHSYNRLKVAEIVIAAVIPITAGLSAPAVVTASLGALVVILESVQQLFQFHTNYVLYRSTAESLKHERALYLAQAGPYRGDDRRRVLAERLEGLISQEHAKWTQSREHTEAAKDSATQ